MTLAASLLRGFGILVYTSFNPKISWCLIKDISVSLYRAEIGFLSDKKRNKLFSFMEELRYVFTCSPL